MKQATGWTVQSLNLCRGNRPFLQSIQIGAGAQVAYNLTLTLLTWTIWWAPTNTSKWRMGFNSAFKALMGTGVLSQGWSGRGVMLATHLHLAPRLKRVELYLYSPNMPSWRRRNQLYLSTYRWYDRSTKTQQNLGAPSQLLIHGCASIKIFPLYSLSAPKSSITTKRLTEWDRFLESSCGEEPSGDGLAMETN